MSQVTRRGPVKPSLNITPLIDVVFLLIVFFMLVMTIVNDEIPELQLPELDDPETYQREGESRVIVNIIPQQRYELKDGEKHGPGKVEDEVLGRNGTAEFVSVGKDKWEIADPDQMKAFTEFVAETVAFRLQKDPTKPPMMYLRADAAVYYSQVMVIMNFYQQAMIDGGLDPMIQGQTDIHLVAYMPVE